MCIGLLRERLEKCKGFNLGGLKRDKISFNALAGSANFGFSACATRPPCRGMNCVIVQGPIRTVRPISYKHKSYRSLDIYTHWSGGEVDRYGPQRRCRADRYALPFDANAHNGGKSMTRQRRRLSERGQHSIIMYTTAVHARRRRGIPGCSFARVDDPVIRTQAADGVLKRVAQLLRSWARMTTMKAFPAPIADTLVCRIAVA